MKNQALFSSKDKSKKIKMLSAAGLNLIKFYSPFLSIHFPHTYNIFKVCPRPFYYISFLPSWFNGFSTFL